MKKPSLLSRLMSGKYYMTPLPGAGNEIVVMVHGLIRRGMNMYHLGRKINKAGYAVYVYDYATTIKGIAAHGRDFRAYLEKIARENPDSPINIVTHSMGGIITREALAAIASTSQRDADALPLSRFKRVVMLAPPNHGSDAARRAVKLLPFTRRLIKPLPELSSHPDAYIHQVPVPQNVEIGIIAGRFDFEVSRKYTFLYGAVDHTVINSDHSFIMYMPKAAALCIKFLKDGRF